MMLWRMKNKFFPEIYSNIEFVVDELSLEESEQELPQECTTIGQKKGEIPEKENTWKNYTPKNLKEKKHKKLSVYNKPAPKILERNSYMN
ncbi:hypothetical protein JTB14_015346 [Gonioctena quinquepunctata]|nr:hypothetical protein JTB14_015346 [Gonioctena quinquepunctata]